MKNGWIIFGVAALLIFGASQATDKQIKKTGADDVMFRTSDIIYSIDSSIAFNLACDGSDLNQHNYRNIVTYVGYASCDEFWGVPPIISDLPGNSISDGYGGTFSCISPINMYLSTGEYRVCCSTTIDRLRVTSYDDESAGSLSAVSQGYNEKMCEAGPVPCEVTFTEATDYLNQWVSCGADTCNP